MADHIRTLKWDQTKGFIPEQDLTVCKGDTISFKLEVTPPDPNATFEVNIEEPTFFSVKEVTDSTPIKVIAALQKRVRYHCRLVGSNGTPLFISSAQQPGGGVRP
jgi:hypothetical protein